jgi:hypothetical protein
MVKSKFRDDKPYVYNIFIIFSLSLSVTCKSSARVVKSLALLTKFSEK